VKRPQAPQQLLFQSRLERISTEAEYFAVSVPLKVSRALGTRGPVAVSAKISARGNDSESFLVSLFPVGGGRHYIRIKAKVRKEAKIKEGERVRVQITVIDRSGEIFLPKDLASALRSEGVLSHFKALPKGKASYIIRKIDEAAKPETRKKRIQDAVEAAHLKREQQIR
jgi:hypothetical protein